MKHFQMNGQWIDNHSFSVNAIYIKKTKNPSILLEELHSNAPSQFYSRSHTPLDPPITLLGTITKNQYYALEGISNSSYQNLIKGRWQSHKKGWRFSDKEVTLLNQIKNQCKTQTCAFILRDSQQVQETSSDLTVKNPDTSKQYFTAECFKEHEGFINGDYHTKQGAIDSLTDSMKHGCISPSIKLVIPLETTSKTTKMLFNEVRYFRIQ